MAGTEIFTTLPGAPPFIIGIVEAVPNDNSNAGLSTSYITTPIPIYGASGGSVITAYYSDGALHPASLSAQMTEQSGAQTTSGPLATSTQSPAVSTSLGLPASSPEPTQRTTTDNTSSASGAAAPAAPSSSPMPTVALSNNGLSGGAVGGIAVACIVVAALVAGLITWALMRKHLNHYRNLAAGAGAAGGSYSNHSHPEKGTSSSVSPRGGADTSFLSGILPVAADDKEIKQRVNNVLEGAAIHVDNFYENTKIAVPAEVARRLDQFDSPLLTTSTRNMLAQGMLPKVVITRALTETLTSSIDPQTSSGWSLLPAAFSAVPGPINKNDRNISAEQKGQAVFWWRQLSAYLSPSTQDNKAYLDSRAQIIAELTNTFQTAFRPWRKTKYTPQQETDALMGTFTSAADTGVWLFGQRSMFSFTWTRNTPPGEIEVRPVLFKTTDVNGRALSRPREVLPRQLERSGGGAL